MIHYSLHDQKRSLTRSSSQLLKRYVLRGSVKAYDMLTDDGVGEEAAREEGTQHHEREVIAEEHEFRPGHEQDHYEGA